MNKRIANKIIKAVSEYRMFLRWDMPYNGNQIYKAAKMLIPPVLLSRYKGWHKETELEGKINFQKRINDTINKMSRLNAQSQQSKALEREIDMEIDRVNRCLDLPEYKTPETPSFLINNETD